MEEEERLHFSQVQHFHPNLQMTKRVQNEMSFRGGRLLENIEQGGNMNASENCATIFKEELF